MKKTLILFFLALLAAPLWGQRTYGELSIDELRQAANNGDAIAQSVLGDRYYEGDRAPQDYKQAVYWYTKAANQGKDEAQCNLGVCYDNGDGVAQDKKQAVYWYTKAANQGHAVAQHNLGSCYYNGGGVAKDYKQAVYWYTKAANQGEAAAQHNLGSCYYNGKGVAKDYKQAVYWYTKAANQGYAEAQYYLGLCNFKGQGVAQDKKQAVHWYTKAANQGDAEAQYNLGNSYHNGEGVAQDYKQAVYWYTKAANQGVAEAQYNLGECYYKGYGVAQDYKQALSCFLVAQSRGYYRGNCDHYGGDEEDYWDDGFSCISDYITECKKMITSASSIHKSPVNNHEELLENPPRTAKYTYEKAYDALSVDHAVFSFMIDDVRFSIRKALGHSGISIGLYHIGSKVKNGDFLAGSKPSDPHEISIFFDNGIVMTIPPFLKWNRGKRILTSEIWEGNIVVRNHENSESSKNQLDSSSCFHYMLSHFNIVKVVVDNKASITFTHLRSGEMFKMGFEKLKKELGTEATADLVYNDPSAYNHFFGLKKSTPSVSKPNVSAAELYSRGEAYFNGDGVEHSPEKAVELWTQSAEKGYTTAQLMLAECYKDGIGAKKDLRKAFEWYSKAASGGNANAQGEVALAYFHGNGVQADLSKAEMWAKKAWAQRSKMHDVLRGDVERLIKTDLPARKKQQSASRQQSSSTNKNQTGGNTQAKPRAISDDPSTAADQYELATRYHHGTAGKRKDTKKAIHWYTRAANQGSPEAMLELGRIYYYGSSVDKDPDEALYWLQKIEFRQQKLQSTHSGLVKESMELLGRIRQGK